MTILGIEFKASEALLALVTVQDTADGQLAPGHVAAKPARLVLTDGDKQESVTEFAKAVTDYINNAQVSRIYIRKRAKKGPYSGGAETFRMEGIVQYVSTVPVTLVSAQAIAAAQKKNSIDVPDSLAKYQHNAWLCAAVGLAKDSRE